MTEKVSVDDIYVIIGSMINKGDEKSAYIISKLLEDYENLNNLYETNKNLWFETVVKWQKIIDEEKEQKEKLRTTPILQEFMQDRCVVHKEDLQRLERIKDKVEIMIDVYRNVFKYGYRGYYPEASSILTILENIYE